MAKIKFFGTITKRSDNSYGVGIPKSYIDNKIITPGKAYWFEVEYDA